MKKVSKRVQNTQKINDGKYVSLNGDTLNKFKGGLNLSSSGNTDHACGNKCGNTAGMLIASV